MSSELQNKIVILKTKLEEVTQYVSDIKTHSTKPYIELQYIQTTGTQYIDTGIKCKDSLKYQVKFSFQRFTSSNYFGNRNTGENDVFRFFSTSQNSGRWYLDYGSGESRNRIYGGTSTLNTIYNFEVGNRYIKNLDTATNIISSSEVSFADKSYNFLISAIDEYLTIYNLRLYDDNVLVRDLIPVKRKSDDLICMYDKVTKTFFTNAGTGDFVAGPVKPSELYTELQYIQSTGTQYIDTGFVPDHNTGFEIDIIMNSPFVKYSTSGYVFGARSAWNSNRFQMSSWADFAGGQFGYYSSDNYNPGMSLGNRVQISLRNHILINGTGSQISITDQTFTSPSSLTLFACHENNNVIENGKVVLYSCKLYDNESLVRDFIPVERKSDGMVGLYDEVTNNFFVNQGTGDFVAGPKK